MVKKKKIEEDLDLENDYMDEELYNDDLDYDYLSDSKIKDFDDLSDTPPVNALGFAHEFAKESGSAKHFKEIPKEIRTSFLNEEDKNAVKHHARTFRNWKYIEKILKLREREDDYKSQLDVFTIKDKETLIQYLQSTNRDYLIRVVDDLEQEEIKQLVTHITKELKPFKLQDIVLRKKQELKDIVTEYDELYQTPEYIDDMDNSGKMFDTIIVSYGKDGKGASHSIMQINAVKNEDIQKDTNEQRKFSLLDSIKRRFSN